MKRVRFETAHDFLERAYPFLMKDEAENNLILSLAQTLLDHSDRFREPLYLAVVEEDDEPVAVALCIPPRQLALTRAHRDALRLIAEDLHGEATDFPGFVGPDETAEAFADLWEQIAGARCAVSMAQRIFRLTRVNDVPFAPGFLRPAREADRELLVRWAEGFAAEILPREDRDGMDSLVGRFVDDGTLHVWEHNRVVSMARGGSPTPGGMRLDLVYTPPEHRQKGYATSCVAALSKKLLDAGCRFVFLDTDLANPTSNRLYTRIGYEPVGDSTQYRIET